MDWLRTSLSMTIPLRDPALAKYLNVGTKTTAGIHVTNENAFTFSAVFDAVNQIASDVAKLPLNLRKRRDDGGSDPYVESKLYRLLKFQPNPEMGSMVFRRTITAHALTCKGGFAEIERDGMGRVVALWPLNPHKVTPDRDGAKRLFYRYQNDSGTETILDPSDVIHLTGIGFDPHHGYPTIQYARQAIGLALAVEAFGAAFFGNGAKFGGVLSMLGINSEEEANRLREVIEGRYNGPENAHKFLVTWGDMKYEDNGVAPEQSQMNDLRSKQVEEVARFFNMPVHKLKNLDRATNNNIEQQDLEYYKGPILNWITLWEEETNRKLIPPLEARSQFIKHNANAFLRGDTVSRTALYTALLDRGVFNADMVLELEDLNPQPNGQGKMYLVQGAMVPKHKIEAVVDSTIKKNETPAPAPAPPASGGGDADRFLAALTERVEKAEALAAEARGQAQAERDIRIAAETKAGASEAEKAEALAREQAAVIRAEQLDLVLAEAKRELETAKVQIADEIAARDAAIALGDAVRQKAEADVLAADVRVENARVACEAADAKRAQAEALAATQTAGREAADVSLAAVSSELEAARTQAAQAASELATAQAEAERLRTAEAAAIEARDALTAELDVTRETAEMVAAERDQAAQKAAELAALAQAAAETTSTVEARVMSLETERRQAEAAAKAAKQAEGDADAAVIAAHRALVVHEIRAALEREADRAQRNQQTPEKLQKWITTWYDSHAELMTAALLPAIAVHLAWIRSTEAPGDVVRAIVAEHVSESQRQLSAVVDGDAGALARNLAQLVHRWQTERVTVLADRLMQKELEYAKRRTAA